MTEQLCSQEICKNVATISYVWPGREERSYACDRCFDKAKGVSETMGFNLGDVRSEAARCD